MRTAVTLLAFLVLAAPAAATTPPPSVLRFEVGPGVGTRVSSYTYGADQRMALVRQGRTVTEGTGPRLMTPGLQPGDVASVYVGGSLRFSATYDGLPAIDGACVGRSSFTFTRGGLGQQWRAGLLTPLDYPRDSGIPFGAERTDGGLTLPVTLPRALALGDYAFAATGFQERGLFVLSSRIVIADQCPAEPVTPTAKVSLSQAAKKLRTLRLTRGKRFRLPVRYSEPGTFRLRISARGRTVATGTRTRAVAGDANVTLRVSRRLRTRRVTLHATFTPARAGAAAQRARTTLRVR